MRAILMPLLVLAAAPSWAVSGPVLSYGSPASPQVDVATDAACAVQGACNLESGACTGGMVGMACQTDTDCAGRINT